MILCLDPGKTTGYALFDDAGVPKSFGQLQGLDKLQDFLTMALRETEPEKFISLVVFEDYILRNEKTRNMNQHQKEGHQVTLRAVGIIEMACKMTQKEFKKVPASEKEAGYRYKSLPKAKDHKYSHERDALAIGYAYFYKSGKLKIARKPFP